MSSSSAFPSSDTSSSSGATGRRPALDTLRQIDEEDRMEALRSYQLLGPSRDRQLDELTKLAAFICGTAVSLVSITDTNRQFFKSRFGFEIQESPRATSFCQYAMRSEDVFEIPDTQNDPDFRDNPLVIENPFVRFYAGVPLLTPEGLPLGTLCTLDIVPHQLSHEQREALRILGRQVSAHLELGRARLQLAEEREKIDNILRLANSAAESAMAGGWRNEIFVKQDHRLVRVLTADIHYVEALGDYVNLYTSRERYTVYSTMKEMEAKLPLRDFARVHRKYIVRLDHIMAIENDQVVLDTPQENTRLSETIPIGSSYKASLFSRLQQV
jgi:hypothetical protein